MPAAAIIACLPGAPSPRQEVCLLLWLIPVLFSPPGPELSFQHHEPRHRHHSPANRYWAGVGLGSKHRGFLPFKEGSFVLMSSEVEATKGEGAVFHH